MNSVKGTFMNNSKSYTSTTRIEVLTFLSQWEVVSSVWRSFLGLYSRRYHPYRGTGLDTEESPDNQKHAYQNYRLQRKKNKHVMSVSDANGQIYGVGADVQSVCAGFFNFILRQCIHSFGEYSWRFKPVIFITLYLVLRKYFWKVSRKSLWNTSCVLIVSTWTTYEIFHNTYQSGRG